MQIEEIKVIRKQLGLTQGELAKKANVSQSLIAKIESDNIDPSYTNAQKIFLALEEMGKKKEIKAGEIMNNNLIFVSPNDDIKKAIVLMKKYNISQLPVVEEHKSIGLISESTILDAMVGKKGNKIKDIMQDSCPVVSKITGINIISDLLRVYPLVLVSENGKLKGVITKSDLLNSMYGRKK